MMMCVPTQLLFSHRPNEYLPFSLIVVFSMRKYRYIYFTGAKDQRKKWSKQLNYPVEPYPKGDNKRYDASYEPDVQAVLFKEGE